VGKMGPQVLDFPLWEWEDTVFIARRKNELKDFIPYATGTTAKIIFTSGKTVIEVPGEINGSTATFTVLSDVVANVRNGATWRVQFTVDGLDESPVIGKVSRKYV